MPVGRGRFHDLDGAPSVERVGREHDAGVYFSCPHIGEGLGGAPRVDEFGLHLVDYPQGGVTMEDCAFVNRKIFSFLETTNMLGDDFAVEVNSPGLDRSLKTRSDFLRVKGRYVMLWLIEPFMGKAYIEGELLDIHNDFLVLMCKGNRLDVPLKSIKTGKERITA